MKLSCYHRSQMRDSLGPEEEQEQELDQLQQGRRPTCHKDDLLGPGRRPTCHKDDLLGPGRRPPGEDRRQSCISFSFRSAGLLDSEPVLLFRWVTTVGLFMNLLLIMHAQWSDSTEIPTPGLVDYLFITDHACALRSDRTQRKSLRPAGGLFICNCFLACAVIGLGGDPYARAGWAPRTAGCSRWFWSSSSASSSATCPSHLLRWDIYIIYIYMIASSCFTVRFTSTPWPFKDLGTVPCLTPLCTDVTCTAGIPWPLVAPALAV